MSQHDFEIANQGFPSFRSDLNGGLQALASNSAGATAPSSTYAYQFWYETDTNLLKMRNADDDAWITLAYFDQTNDEWEIRSAVIQAVDSAGVTIKNDGGTTLIQAKDDGSVVFRTDDVTIDTSGNLLVGKTATGLNTDGIQLLPNGSSAFTRDGERPLFLNRRSSDGDILEFRKDNSAVGLIGARGGNLYTGSGDTALKFIASFDAITPATGVDGAGRDAAIDLGGSGSRFKDLYLSGGVYLSGTTSADYLNTYEEGTWTPEFASDSGTDPTCTYDNIQFGYYQRVGDWVHCTGGLRTDSVSGGTSNLAIKGLPFAGESTTITGTTCRQAGTLGQVYDWGGNAPSAVYIFEGLTKLFLHKRSSTSALSDQTQIPIGNLVNGTNKNGIHFSITYKIN